MPPSIGWTTRCVRLSRRRAVAAGILLFVVACVTHPPRPAPPPTPVDTTPAPVRPDTMRPEPIEQAPPPSENALQGGTIVRIALSAGAPHVTVSGSGEWRLYDSGGESTLLRANAGDLWTIESRDGALRAVHDDGSASPWRPAPFVARPVTRGALLSVNGRRYRGEIWVRPVTGGVMVINRLYLEDYLRGVVPLEIGKRAPGEEAAVAAQAVAARSYAYTHLLNSPTRPYDMLATVMDQVYGGADAETTISDAAVMATSGLVLRYGGRIVNAPYHSTCGGQTAAASEVWRTDDEPYLVSVSDRIPGTDRYYCDIAPRFEWERTFTRDLLRNDLDRYLATYATVPRGGPGVPRQIEVEHLTPSGRVQSLVITTDRGRYTLRANDIRFVLRTAGGEILNSTYFSVRTERDGDGRVSRLEVQGHGYGHGVGMCQWGAIGRARAGQDFRTILATYYPGTEVAPASE